jgi:hypothetical protein
MTSCTPAAGHRQAKHSDEDIADGIGYGGTSQDKSRLVATLIYAGWLAAIDAIV